jgi:hypothetical protein
MRHLDEGELHAYLDAHGVRGRGAGSGAEMGERPATEPGAAVRQRPPEPDVRSGSPRRAEAARPLDVERHLAECAECRARLEEVARVRDRAAGILARAVPEVAAPPFEKVLAARAGRSVAGAGPAKRSWYPQLAWAAAVALVLGAGWFAAWSLGRIGQPQISTGADSRTKQPGAQGALAEHAAGADSALAIADQRVAGEGRQIASAADADRVVAGDRANQPSAGPDATERPRAARQAEQLGPPPAPAEGPADVTRATVEEKRAADEAAAAGVAGVQRGVPAAPAPQRVVAEGEFRPVGAPRAQLAIVRARDTAWTPAGEADAARRLGGPVAVVEGLPLTGVFVREEAGAVAVRVTQQLDPGQEVELIQRREDSTEQQAVPAGRGRGEASRIATATVSWRGYSVRATAPVPAESLRVLLARLRPR